MFFSYLNINDINISKNYIEEQTYKIKIEINNILLSFYTIKMQHTIGDRTEHEKYIYNKGLASAIDILKIMKQQTPKESLIMLLKIICDIEYLELENHDKREECDKCLAYADIDLHINLLQCTVMKILAMFNNYNTLIIGETIRKLDMNQDIKKILYDTMYILRDLQYNYIDYVVKHYKTIVITNKQCEDILNIMLEMIKKRTSHDEERYHYYVVNVLNNYKIEYNKDKRYNVMNFMERLDLLNKDEMYDLLGNLYCQYRFLINKINEHYVYVPDYLLYQTKCIEIVIDKFKKTFEY